jgi:hypothetical protein
MTIAMLAFGALLGGEYGATVGFLGGVCLDVLFWEMLTAPKKWEEES